MKHLKQPIIQALEDTILRKANSDPEFVCSVVTNTNWDLSDSIADKSNVIDGVRAIEYPVNPHYCIVRLVRQNESVILRTDNVIGFYD